MKYFLVLNCKNGYRYEFSVKSLEYGHQLIDTIAISISEGKVLLHDVDPEGHFYADLREVQFAAILEEPDKKENEDENTTIN